MVRWRYSLFLAMLLLVPAMSGPKLEEEEDESRVDDTDDEDEEDDDDDEDTEARAQVSKLEQPKHAGGRRAPAVGPTLGVTTQEAVTRTVARRPLECYVCAYKAETQLRSCLDPTKYRVHTMVCHSADDKCFTSVISKDSTYDAVMRGCRSGCIGTPETTCCEVNRCNNQALAIPLPVARSSLVSNKSAKTIPPSVLFFVSILLVLQTVVKVAFV